MSGSINLIKIAEDEILGFDGVSGFPRKSRKSRNGEYIHPNIKITEEDGEYIINIDILVKFGTNIPQLCYDIQTGLIHSLIEKAGIVVKMVNIRVEGIDSNL